MDGGRPRFGVLGPLAVRVDGEPVDLGSPKQRAVLGVLLALAPRAVPVDRLVDEVWGERGPRDPLRNLQVHVSALRHALGAAADVLVTEGRAYRLVVGADQVDAVRFEDEVRAAAARMAEGDPAGTAAALDEALALWRGEAWQDLRELPAIAPDAVRLDELRLAAERLRAEAMLALGRHRDLVPRLEALVLAHPLDEDLRGHLMLALHRCGRQSEALEVYAAGRALKAEETGLDPGEALQRLHAAILADDPALRAEDAALRARRHLPAQVTRLVGREGEVAELAEVLRSGDARLVTITGPGGIGKTRVGLAVADALAPDLPDGVWFVALDAVRDARLVPQALADALGVAEVGGDLLRPLRAHLGSRRLLVVLDNFEQVESAAPLLSELLAVAPGLRLLVTSRARLRLYGERVRVLDPLPAADAVPLFVERARSADHRFDGSDTARIAALCDALDRLPLAIELVAARVGELPIGEMAAQLAERAGLDLAGEGPRDRAPRQQTLRHAIGWSVDLLPDREEGCFLRLGAFLGGFDVEAAAAVARADEEVLATLARVSLLVPDGDGRFRMLETVRRYAEERAGELLAEARDAHAAWFLRLAEDSVGGMRGPGQPAWKARLGAERGNMRAALAWLATTAGSDRPAGERVLRMAAALGLYWYRAGPGTEDVEWLPRALALAPDADPHTRGRAHYALAICRAEQGRAEEALEHSRAAYDLLRSADDPTWTSRALNTLAGLTRDLGHPAEAAVLMDESIALRRADRSVSLTIALGNRAIAALDLGDLATARACLLECLEAEGEDDLEVALAHARLVDVEIEAGDLDRAAELLRASLPVLAQHEQSYRLAESLDSLAALAVRRGRAALAVTLLAAADRALAEEGAVMVPADAAFRERRTGEAIRALDPETRASAHARGAALSLDDALELARTELL